MNDETKKPLWKVLNEQRTQGEWHISQSPVRLSTLSGLPFKSIKTTRGLGGKIVTNAFGRYANGVGKDEAEANAQYTALAVNNLYGLAEALQLQIDEWHSVDSNFHKEEPPSLKAAREALNRIS